MEAFRERRALSVRRSHTLCPVWSTHRSGTPEPRDSGREGRRQAGSRAAGRSCGDCGCTCTHGGDGGCRGVLVQASAGFTHTHTHTEVNHRLQLEETNFSDSHMN